MTAKADLIRSINLLSSGTIAGFVGSNKYSIIDNAVSKAILYAAQLTEEECAAVRTMEDIANLFRAAWKKIK